ncbi:hypothetical protein TI39_contig354g00099 [Zymoseptoria brevis]|uniref:Wax synthase domain-containing protein n=1 Tax=Zymoseptoria brevis TaxID=1047168 RepID=A0A0F4GQL6_9PEZI|nr:hypothetical protein TI39_contig354g00099 [Zymoseptoria brevis]
MLPPDLETPRQVKQYYYDLYDELIESGQFRPFVYPWVALGAITILVYLLIDHRRSPTLQALRFPLYGFLCAFSGWCIATNRGRHPAAAYGVGLINAWGTLWCGTIMFFNDCQVDFQRIEHADNGVSDSSRTNGGILPSRSLIKSKSEGQSNETMTEKQESTEVSATPGPSKKRGSLYWQSYPSGPVLERLEWISDLFCSFRGVGWNIKSAGMPSIPTWVKAELDGHESKPSDRKAVDICSAGTRRFSDRDALLRYVFIRLVIGFFALDAIKTLMHHDPYFWGYMDAPPPAFLPGMIRSSAVLVKCYRLLLSLAGIHTPLLEIFRLGPLFFCGVLGPSILGVRGEAWMNPPDFFGNLSTIFNKGLAGFWGEYWHQTFRYSFEAPAKRVLEYLKVEKRSSRGRLLSILLAFSLSGCLHACGSHTQLGATRPIAGPFCFFLLQGIGIISQTAISDRLRKVAIFENAPKVTQQSANFAFTVIWLYHTAPLLTDDFAKGGVWLYEPVAFSPLRLIGLGAKDDRSWDLWFDMIRWRSGKHFWDTGIAF